jgi:hypothetical protein
MEPTQCSETSAFNNQTPGKYPEDNLSLQQHGESLKTRAHYLLFIYVLIKFALCNISYIASNIGQGVKFEMERLENKLSLSNLLSVHIACLSV